MVSATNLRKADELVLGIADHYVEIPCNNAEVLVWLVSKPKKEG
jgi:hypothetical protein